MKQCEIIWCQLLLVHARSDASPFQASYQPLSLVLFYFCLTINISFIQPLFLCQNTLVTLILSLPFLLFSFSSSLFSFLNLAVDKDTMLLTLVGWKWLQECCCFLPSHLILFTSSPLLFATSLLPPPPLLLFLILYSFSCFPLLFLPLPCCPLLVLLFPPLSLFSCFLTSSLFSSLVSSPLESSPSSSFLSS